MMFNADIAKVIAGRASDNVTIVQGVVGRENGVYYATVNGSKIACTWLDTIVVASGDKVLIALQQPKEGTASAIVIGRLTERPRPQYATTVPSPTQTATVKVKDSNGNLYDAVWIGETPPATGSLVALSWQGSTPLILGKRRVSDSEKGEENANTKPTPSITPPKPAPKPDIYVNAITSGTYDYAQYNSLPARWEPYYGSDIKIGVIDSYGPRLGAWFYGSGTQKIKDCTSLKIYLPAAIGRASITITLGLITNITSKNGKPQLTDTFDYTISANWSGGWISLPVAWCKQIANSGGGIGVTSKSSGGFTGVTTSTKSGQLYGK